MMGNSLAWSVLPLIVVLSLAGGKLEIEWSTLENVSNSSVAASDARITKVNRTLAVLRGNWFLLETVDNNYIVSGEFFHSPLGNNQFTKTPYKLPMLGVCSFTRVFLPEYGPFFEDSVENLPQPDECPVSPRTLIFKDGWIDPDSLPEYLRPGLWKAVVKLVRAFTLENMFEVHLYFKVIEEQ